MESYTSAFLPRCSRVVFVCSFLGCCFGVGAVWGGGRGCHRSLLCFPLLNVHLSAVVNTNARAASLPFTPSGSMDPGLPRGFWQKHGPWASTYSPASAHAKDLFQGPWRRSNSLDEPFFILNILSLLKARVIAAHCCYHVSSTQQGHVSTTVFSHTHHHYCV